MPLCRRIPRQAVATMRRLAAIGRGLPVTTYPGVITTSWDKAFAEADYPGCLPTGRNRSPKSQTLACCVGQCGQSPENQLLHRCPRRMVAQLWGVSTQPFVKCSSTLRWSVFSVFFAQVAVVLRVRCAR
jgi:hypothetical protein